MGHSVCSDSRASYDLLTCSNIDLMMQGPSIPSAVYKDRMSLYPAARSRTSLPHNPLGGSSRITRSVETLDAIVTDDAHAVLFGTLGAARQGEQGGDLSDDTTNGDTSKSLNIFLAVDHIAFTVSGVSELRMVFNRCSGLW